MEQNGVPFEELNRIDIEEILPELRFHNPVTCLHAVVATGMEDAEIVLASKLVENALVARQCPFKPA